MFQGFLKCKGPMRGNHEQNCSSLFLLKADFLLSLHQIIGPVSICLWKSRNACTPCRGIRVALNGDAWVQSRLPGNSVPAGDACHLQEVATSAGWRTAAGKAEWSSVQGLKVPRPVCLGLGETQIVSWGNVKGSSANIKGKWIRHEKGVQRTRPG